MGCWRKLCGRDEQIVERGGCEQRERRRQHGESRDRQRRIAREVWPVEHAADRAGRSAREDRKLARKFAPAVNRGAVQDLVAEREEYAEQRREDAGELAKRDALMSEQRRDDKRQQREGREDQRTARRRDCPKAVVEQRDQYAELADAERRDRHDVGARKTNTRCQYDGRDKAANANGIAQEGQRGG